LVMADAVSVCHIVTNGNRVYTLLCKIIDNIITHYLYFFNHIFSKKPSQTVTKIPPFSKKRFEMCPGFIFLLTLISQCGIIHIIIYVIIGKRDSL
jgi:hypothetical protein